MPSRRLRRAFERKTKWYGIPVWIVLGLLAVFAEELIRGWAGTLANMAFFAVLTPLLEEIANHPGWFALLFFVLFFGGVFLWDYYAEGHERKTTDAIVGDPFALSLWQSERNKIRQWGVTVESKLDAYNVLMVATDVSGIFNYHSDTLEHTVPRCVDGKWTKTTLQGLAHMRPGQRKNYILASCNETHDGVRNIRLSFLSHMSWLQVADCAFTVKIYAEDRKPIKRRYRAYIAASELTLEETNVAEQTHTGDDVQIPSKPYDMSIRDALVHMTGIDPGNSTGHQVHYDAAEELCQAAFEGRISIWGKEIKGTAVFPRFIKIPDKYWEYNQLNPATIFGQNPLLPQTRLIAGRPNTIDYVQLHLNHDEVRDLSKENIGGRLKHYYECGVNEIYSEIRGKNLAYRPRSANDPEDAFDPDMRDKIRSWSNSIVALLYSNENKKASEEFSSNPIRNASDFEWRLSALMLILRRDYQVQVESFK